MGRWAHLDTDEERLPEGMTRTGYDADTQTYSYRDADGSTWEGAPGNQYGRLHKVHSPPPRLPAIWFNEDDEGEAVSPIDKLEDYDPDEDEKRGGTEFGSSDSNKSPVEKPLPALPRKRGVVRAKHTSEDSLSTGYENDSSDADTIDVEKEKAAAGDAENIPVGQEHRQRRSRSRKEKQQLVQKPKPVFQPLASLARRLTVRQRASTENNSEAREHQEEAARWARGEKVGSKPNRVSRRGTT